MKNLPSGPPAELILFKMTNYLQEIRKVEWVELCKRHHPRPISLTISSVTFSELEVKQRALRARSSYACAKNCPVVCVNRIADLFLLELWERRKTLRERERGEKWRVCIVYTKRQLFRIHSPRHEVHGAFFMCDTTEHDAITRTALLAGWQFDRVNPISNGWL